jgi:hypothetical protein
MDGEVMKAGVLRRLTDEEAYTLAQTAHKLGDGFTVLGFAYQDMATAEGYAARNRELGHTVIGPVVSADGEVQDVVICQPVRPQRG